MSFIDSDDMVLPDLLRDAFMGIEGYDQVCFNFCEKATDGTITGHSAFSPGPVCWMGENEQFAFLFVLYLGFRYAYSTCNKLYRRSIIDRNHIRFEKNASYAEDLCFNFLYYLHARSLNCLQQELYSYCVRQGSTMQEYKKHIYFDRINQMAKHIESYISSQDGFELLKKKSSLFYIAMLQSEIGFFRSRHPELTIKDIRKLLIKDIKDRSYYHKNIASPQKHRKDLLLRYGRIETEQIISEFRYLRDGRFCAYCVRYIIILGLKLVRKAIRISRLLFASH